MKYRPSPFGKNQILLQENGLYHLDLSKNHLSSLPDIIFENKLELRSLILSDNNLAIISDLLKEGFLKLEILDLSYNKIIQIDQLNFPALKHLNLNNNNIAKLDIEIFKNCNFTTLKLKENTLILHNTSRTMPYLEELGITLLDNNLDFLYTKSLKYLKKLDLDIWNIKDNNISIDKLFQNYKSLETLHLTFHKFKIFEFSNTIFKNINLKNFQLLSDDMGNMPDRKEKSIFYCSFLASLKNIQKISLKEFHGNIKEDCFKYLSNVLQIDLSESDLKKIPKQLFENTTKLHNLNLSNTGLTELSEGIFQNLHQLLILDLSRNNLGDFSR